MGGQVFWMVLTCLLLSNVIEGKPRAQHRWSSYGTNEPAYSASSYDSLGIQPSRSGRNQQPQQSAYWWQGPKSPFSEGAASNQGVRPQTVVGCSGDGCSSPLFSGPSISASSAATSNSIGGSSSNHISSGGNCCNYYWQKPSHPCSTHQGNDCPRGFSCVNYRSCSNGVISHVSSGYASQNPSLDELMNYGRPCGSSGREVCCQEAPVRPQQPVVQQPVVQQPVVQQPEVAEGPIVYQPAPAFPTEKPVIHHPAPTYYPPAPAPPPPTHKPVYYPPPVYTPAPAPPPVYTPAPPAYQPAVYQPPAPTPPPPVYTPSPPAYQPPSPVYTPAPPAYQPPPPPVFTPAPPTYQPATRPPTPPPTQAAVAQGPPANLLPYPGCAAALKCVTEEYCGIDGVMINTPVFLTDQQKEFRTPLMACLNTETNLVGFCCRDPLYNDPWPADMPMPFMPAKPPIQPVVQQSTYAPAPPPTLPPTPPPTPPPTLPPTPPPTRPPTPPPTTQPPFVQCYPTEDCVQPYVCNSLQQPFNNQPNAKCQTFDGQIGVCCPRPPPPTTTTPPPPPPPPVQPVVVPPDSYLPPPPPPPVQPVEIPSENYLPPPLPTPPPVEILPPPATQPSISYVPPPPPPPTAPVIEQSYVPPPPPVPAAQVVDNQCGISRPIIQQLNPGEAALGQFPWHAMIAQVNGSMSCSGALIGPKFVATSFHCVQGVIPSNLRVRLGEQRVGATDEPLPHYEIPVSAVVGHPEFAEGSLFHDTAVLMLAAPAPTGQAHIAPICLPQQSDPQVSQCVVSGWGHDTLSGLQSGILNQVQVDIVQNSDCQNSLQSTHLGKYFKLHKSFTCASTQNSINPCKVDGGSPLACKRPDGSHVLIGLSSWSVGCSNQQQPGVFADVMAVAPWMEQQMAKPEASLVEQSNSAFENQQQFQSQFGTGAGYGR